MKNRKTVAFILHILSIVSKYLTPVHKLKFLEGKKSLFPFRSRQFKNRTRCRLTDSLTLQRSTFGLWAIGLQCFRYEQKRASHQLRHVSCYLRSPLNEGDPKLVNNVNLMEGSRGEGEAIKIGCTQIPLGEVGGTNNDQF